MLQYQMVQNVKILLGVDAMSELGELLSENGKKKPLLVCDEGIRQSGILDTAIAAVEKAELPYAVFSEVQADPPAELVRQGFAFYQDNGCDSVVGIGGGSSIDTSKAINLMAHNSGHDILDFTKPDCRMNPAPGLVVVPTTSGTGSELSDGLIISEGHVKHPILALDAMSEFAILDPRNTVSLPPHITASTGMDALAQAVEAYISNVATSFTDMISEKIIEMVKEWLPKATSCGTDLKAREEMCLAACMSGWMLKYAHSVAGHSTAHILGGYYHIPHGFACAYALPEIVEFNAPAVPEKTKWVGRVFGVEFCDDDSPEEIGKKTKAALIRFRDETLGLQPASAYAADPKTFAAAAEAIAAEPFQAFNPVKMSAEQALVILKQIFQCE